MTRELRIVETFVELADAMVHRLDAIEFLHRLCHRCVELLECDEAGVLLVDGAGGIQVMGSSSELAGSLELLQSHVDEGPCFDCVQGGVPVTCADLEAARDRWPTFAPAAVERGFRSVCTVPMRVRDEVVGALNLFRAQRCPIDGPDLQVACAMADIAAVALLQDRALRRCETVVEQLQGALVSRVAIEQAKGILAERARIGIDSAFARMRDYARQRNLRIDDVAHELVDGRLAPDTLEESLPS